MIKITRNVGVDGAHFEAGTTYEGPHEKYLVSSGKAEWVKAPTAKQDFKEIPGFETQDEIPEGEQANADGQCSEPEKEPVASTSKKKRGRRT